jgi:hypothetical protein
MDSTIYNGFAKQYSPMLYLLSEQKGSRLQNLVRREYPGAADQWFWDTLDTVEASEVTDRHGDTPLTEIDYGRRRAMPKDYDVGTPLDKEDQLKMIVDPTSSFALRQANGLGRKKDRIIIEAALGTAYIGKEGTSSIDFEDDTVGINGDGTVTTLGTLPAVTTVAAIGLAKILTMSHLFNKEDVDPDIPKYWAISAKEIKDMLDIDELTSADYVSIKALQTGKIENFMGFQFVMVSTKNALLPADAVSGTGRRTFAWAQDGIILGTAKEVTTRIDERPDKRYLLQVYSKMSMGAVRMEGAKVHECLCKIAV